MSSSSPDILPEVRKVLSYDPDTGIFTWLSSLKVSLVGKPAGTKMINGYISVGVAGGRYLAHRLAWLYVHGRWPDKEIDHINGVRADNRITNLREAARWQNMANTLARSDSTSGIKGVKLHFRGRWRARLQVRGKNMHLGYFDTREEAAAAYRKAADALCGPFGRRS